jgi:STE24 endopeptidase
MSVLSRKNEYEADDFAKETYRAEPLIEGLKKLSVDNLANLHPHPFYVFVHFSHPPLLKRIANLRK